MGKVKGIFRMSWTRTLIKTWRDIKKGKHKMENYSLEDAKKIIQHFEGVHDLQEDGTIKAYKDPVGIFTIGWGSTYINGRKVREDDVITLTKANKLLLQDIERFRNGVLHYIDRRITPNQLNALVSFVYNIGEGAFSRSTLLRKLNKNPNDKTIYNEFLRWNKAGGKVFKGLTRRRQSEATLYKDGVIEFFD